MNKISCYLFLLLSGATTYGQFNANLLTQDRVIEDVKNYEGEEIPSDIVLDIESLPIEIFSIKNYEVAHIEFKTGGSEAQFKQSYLIIYSKEGDLIQCENAVPYNYNIELIDSDRAIFLSSNLLSADGKGTNYVEFNQVINDTLITLASYQGIENYLYYHGKMAWEEYDVVESAIEDTITNTYEVSNWKITDKGLESFDLTRYIQILQGYDQEEELLTNDIKMTERVVLIE